jgi:hypothetical protein
LNSAHGPRAARDPRGVRCRGSSSSTGSRFSGPVHQGKNFMPAIAMRAPGPRLRQQVVQRARRPGDVVHVVEQQRVRRSGRRTSSAAARCRPQLRQPACRRRCSACSAMCGLCSKASTRPPSPTACAAARSSGRCRRRRRAPRRPAAGPAGRWCAGAAAWCARPRRHSLRHGAHNARSKPDCRDPWRVMRRRCGWLHAARTHPPPPA